MGLLRSRFDFAHAPPSEDEIRSHVRSYVGTDYSLDRIEIERSDGEHRGASYRVWVYTMMEPLTFPYIAAFLVARGGQPVTSQGEPRAVDLPRFVERPWRAWPWWQRVKFRLGGR